MSNVLRGLGLCGLVLLVGCAASQQPKPEVAVVPQAAPTAATELPSGTVEQSMVTARATVEAIDVKKRLVTLRKPDGSSVTLEVGAEVRNLPQVKKGDQVIVTYYEALAFAVRKPGEAAPGISVAETVERAKPGEKPAGAGAREVTVTATIEEINKKKPSVTLRGPGGKVVTVVPRHPENLERVKVGDLVDITYTEAVAISVEKAPK